LCWACNLFNTTYKPGLAGSPTNIAVSEPLRLLPQLICSGNLMEIALGARSAANIELKIKNIPATAHQSALYMGG